MTAETGDIRVVKARRGKLESTMRMLKTAPPSAWFGMIVIAITQLPNKARKPPIAVSTDRVCKASSRSLSIITLNSRSHGGRPPPASH